MAEYRRFFAGVSERDGERIHLTTEYNHIARVLRLKCGQKCVVCFNDGVDHLCEIVSIDSAAVHIDIISSNISDTENAYTTTLFVGAMKGDKNEFVVQKAVELGADRVVFFDSQFCVMKLDSKKLERYNKISLEASKQCGRSKIVPVEYMTLKNVVVAVKNYSPAILCYEREQHTTLNMALNVQPNNVAIIIGSEGGFAESEVQQLTAAGAISVTLGRRILRAETAPIYVLAVMSNIFAAM
jgi:16S rRNA (uracil1498-N3)-methyltransferase